MNLANWISFFRIVLVPCLVASVLYYHPSRDGLRYLTAGLFILAMLSDALDGFVARRMGQGSQLGAILDPIADKLLVLSMLISLSTVHGLPAALRIPAWFNLIVISRDVILMAGTGLLIAFKGSVPINPTQLGKTAIVAQMLVIPLVLLQLPFKTELLLVAAVLTVISGIDYIRLGLRHFA